jgi:hypothetical protein
VPAKDGRGAQEERFPANLGQNPARRSENRPVVEGEVRPCDLASEHLELMAEHDDLDLLGIFGTKSEDDELKDPAQRPIEQRREDEVACLGLHGKRRLRHHTELAGAPRRSRESRPARVGASFRHPQGRAALVGVERPGEIRHQFSVKQSLLRTLDPAVVLAVFEEYGHTISLEFRTGDLIEIAIDSTTEPPVIEEFLHRASTDYDFVIRVDKTRLLEQLNLSDPAGDARLYFFTDALCVLIQQGLTVFESELWHDASRPLRIYVLDSDTSLIGPWLSISSSDLTSNLPTAEDGDRLRQVREQRDRFIGWDEAWVKELTPSHLWTTGTSNHSDLRATVRGQFVTLTILYLCDRARSHLASDGIRQIRAEFRGGAHVAVIPIPEGVKTPTLEENDLQAVLTLYEWVYSIDEPTGRDWVTERLPFVQTRVAQMLEGRPEGDRLGAFSASAIYLVEGVEWQWKAFIEGKISAYLENRKELETVVGDTSLSESALPI